MHLHEINERKYSYKFMAKKRHRGRRKRSNRWKYFNRMELTEAYRLNDTLIKKYFPPAGLGFELGLGKDDGHHYWLKSDAEKSGRKKVQM